MTMKDAAPKRGTPAQEQARLLTHRLMHEYGMQNGDLCYRLVYEAILGAGAAERERCAKLCTNLFSAEEDGWPQAADYLHMQITKGDAA
jgi:hypothetical protein